LITNVYTARENHKSRPAYGVEYIDGTLYAVSFDKKAIEKYLLVLSTVTDAKYWKTIELKVSK
jgi:hypothetical protein